MLATSEHETRRLAALQRYDILDTPPDQALDDITLLAAQICDTPIALITLVAGDRQWFKSKVGISASETAREIAFCAHAICHPDQIMVVPDARRDERFADNPLVTGEPHVRFYVGVPLVTSDGYTLGTLCVVDRVVRDLSAEQMAALRALRRSVMSELELRRLVNELRERTRDVTESRHAQHTLAGQKQVLEMIASDASLPDILHTQNRIVESQFPGML